MEKENIYQKLLRIQQHVESFVKNKKAFSFSYVDGNQVLNEIRPLMNSVGLLLKQEVLSLHNERYDYSTSKGAAKTEVLSTLEMRFTWIDCETKEEDVNSFFANGMNDFDKGVGSALTYGERYFLLKYFHIPTDADDVDAKQRDIKQVIPKNKVDADFSTAIDQTDLTYLRTLAFQSTLTHEKKEEALSAIEKCTDYKLYEKIKYRLEDLQPSITTEVNPSQKSINSHLKKLA